jgi:hypothetical protein
MDGKKSARVEGTIGASNRTIEVSLSVILFREEGSVIAFCPALNVYGYGETETEAKKSFEFSLSEFFRYTLNKKTLLSELEALGWKIKRNSKFTPPQFSVLLSKNADLKAIFNTRSFKKFDKGVIIPLAA